MTFLPIVGRELRVAARRRSTYWVRVLMAAGAIGIESGLLFFGMLAPPTQIARGIFQGLAGLALLFCLAYGRQTTADCLSVEKREGTLGLLFLTDLKGHDVVLGKLAATSLRGFYGLLAVVPVLAVPLLLGGITNAEFWRTVLVLVVTILFSMAVGMLASALSRDAHRAMGANFGLLLALAVAPSAISGVLELSGLRAAPIQELFFSCPVYPFFLSAESQYLLRADHYWWSVGVIFGLSALLLLLASLIVPRSWQDRPVARTAAGPARRWWSPRPGAGSKLREYRRRLLEINAFYWLAARRRRGPLMVWGFLILMGAWWVVGWISAGSLWIDQATYVVTALLLHSTLKLWLILEAGHRLLEERRLGTLELVLGTSMEGKDILRGQWLALRRQFLGPVIVVLVLEWVLLSWFSQRWHDAVFRAAWRAGMVALVADMAAAAWVAMLLALTSRNLHRASVGAAWRILLLPWVVFGLIELLANLWCELQYNRPWSVSSQTRVILWLALGLGADLWFGGRAWHQLRHHFRALALRRIEIETRRTGSLTERAPAPASPAGRMPGSPPARPRRLTRRRVAFAGAILLALAGIGAWWLRPARPVFPPPALISLSHSNAPLRVSAGGNGLFIILPDGSLWRWGLGGGAFSAAKVPERIETNGDWLMASSSGDRYAGIRRDGSLWEWGMIGGRMNPVPTRVDDGTNWADVAVGATDTAALQRDGTLWAWGINSPLLPPATSSRDQATPTLVGPQRHWVALCGQWSSTRGLRADGSIWVWGTVFVPGPGTGATASLTTPTQICSETNWAGFIGGYPPIACTRAGEAWDLMAGMPSAVTPAAAIGRLLGTNTAPGRFTSAYCGERRVYQIRADGTLWERSCPLGSPAAGAPGNWRQVGGRSDWVWLGGSNGTAIGQTADGMVWTWGYDPTQPPRQGLFAGLTAVQVQIGAVLGGRRSANWRVGGQPFFQPAPRPLMRLLSNGSRDD